MLPGSFFNSTPTRLRVKPGDIAVIQAGLKFKVFLLYPFILTKLFTFLYSFRFRYSINKLAVVSPNLLESITHRSNLMTSRYPGGLWGTLRATRIRTFGSERYG